MMFANERYLYITKKFGTTKRFGITLWVFLSVILFTISMLGACQVYDASLINHQLHLEDAEEPFDLANAQDAGNVELADAFLEQEDDAIGEIEPTSLIKENLGSTCMPNPDDDTLCPWICDEVCDNIDNDCDGETDESEADRTCDLANATATCSQGVCLISQCLNGFGDCDTENSNGCETSLNTLSDCRSCDNECTGISCKNGRCSQLECEGEYADCDGDTANGCETSLGTNSNCGFCEDQCPTFPEDESIHATATGCFENVCRITQCKEGHRDCNNIYNDGCETNVHNEVNNCGDCGLSCLQLPNVLDTECRGGLCFIRSCREGFSDDNDTASDGCEVQQPDPKAPEPGCTLAHHADHSYYFCSNRRSWNDANHHCLDVGMYLVRIDNAQENNFIASRLLDDLWIGANDIETEGLWVWSHGQEPFWSNDSHNHPPKNGFINWMPQEPDNGNNSDCARVRASENGGWRDKECDLLYGYICETGRYFEQCSNPGFCETAEGATRNEGGTCRYPAAVDASCDDNDPCTQNDRCRGDKSCSGAQYDCNNPGFCETTTGAICNGNGTCSYPPAEGSPCDDDDPCTFTDQCQADRTCVGTAYNCDDPGLCETTEEAVCNGDGTCTYPADEGGACIDNNPCTHSDQCQADKTCVGTLYSCDDPGLCETAEEATCNGDGTCTYSADEGRDCDDQNPCTDNDQCQADSSCVGDIDVGADCDDDDICTENDVCDESGVCAGAIIESCEDDGD